MKQPNTQNNFKEMSVQYSSIIELSQQNRIRPNILRHDSSNVVNNDVDTNHHTTYGENSI
jgi:hypothetical protein